MHPIQPLLSIFQTLDGATLSARTFAEACVTSGWPEPVDDGVGLWEVEHPAEGTYLVLDTTMKPPTIICRLEQDDEYDADDLLEDPALRRKFDASFEQALAALRACFPVALTEGTYEKPYKWRFAHFQGAEFSGCVGAERLRSAVRRAAGVRTTAAASQTPSVGNYIEVVGKRVSQGGTDEQT